MNAPTDRPKPVTIRSFLIAMAIVGICGAVIRWALAQDPKWSMVVAIISGISVGAILGLLWQFPKTTGMQFNFWFVTRLVAKVTCLIVFIIAFDKFGLWLMVAVMVALFAGSILQHLYRAVESNPK